MTVTEGVEWGGGRWEICGSYCSATIVLHDTEALAVGAPRGKEQHRTVLLSPVRAQGASATLKALACAPAGPRRCPVPLLPLLPLLKRISAARKGAYASESVCTEEAAPGESKGGDGKRLATWRFRRRQARKYERRQGLTGLLTGR